MDYDFQNQGTCECGHPMGHYDGGKPMHVRKGIEYSTTCFLCPCNVPCERINDIRIKDKPPERTSVFNYIKAIFMFVLLIGSLSAAITVNYTGTKATIMNGANPVANVALLNAVSFNGTDYTLKDCDMFKCRVLLNITPTAGFTTTADTTVSPKITKSVYGTTKADAVYIRNDTTETYYEAKYITVLQNTTAMNNTSGKNITVFYNTTIQNGTTTKLRTVIQWLPFDSGYTFIGSKTITAALDYSRTNLKDISDLVPSFYGLDLSNWAWWNTTWSYAIEIRINTTVASTLTNFPARISMNTTNTTLWNTTTCANVRFLDAANTTLQAYDLDSNNSSFCGNTTNNATFYVKGNYPTGNTTIYAYLGNTGAASGENESGTWVAYGDVYHFSENSATSYASQTGLTPMPVTVANPFTLSNCAYGSCLNTTKGQLINSTATTYAMSSGNITGSCWVYVNAAGGYQQIAQSRWNGGQTWGIDLNTGSTNLQMYNGAAYTSTYQLNTTSKQLVAWRANATGTDFFVNGSKIGTVAGGWASGSTGGFAIGTTNPTNEVFNGFIDECRFNKSAETDDWIKAEYAQLAAVGAIIANTVIPTPNLTIYAQTATNFYNGTIVNYTITAIVINHDIISQTVNISITANGTLVSSANNTAIASNTTYTLVGTWQATRATTDTNFTINITATGSDASILSGSNSTSLTMLLPIDPPSAINLMANGGKTKCRTPNTLGYWTSANWSINSSWQCNYSNLNLQTQFTTNGIVYVDNGTTTFSNSTIKTPFFSRLSGVGMSNFVFMALSNITVKAT